MAADGSGHAPQSSIRINLDDIGIPAFIVEVCGTEFRYRHINRWLSRMTGVNPQTQIGFTPHDVLPVDVAQSVVAQYRACVEAGEPVTYDEEMRRGDAVTAWRTTLAPLFEAGGSRVTSLIGTVTDLSALRAAERETREANVRLSIAMQALNGGFWHYDIASDSFETSPELSRMIGGPDAQPYDFSGFVDKILPEDRGASDFSALVSGEIDRHVAQYRVVDHTGAVRWLQCERRLVRDSKGRPASLIGAALDITEQHNAQELLEKQAVTDPLTGLCNRRGFALMTARLEEKRNRHATAIGILLVDLDSFKPVNDTYGHAAGDEVLKAVGERIKRQLRPGDTVARIGGDEFAILVDNVDGSTMQHICERVAREVSRPLDVDGLSLSVSVSVGATMVSNADRTVAEAQLRADRALYSAKARHSGWVFAN